VIGIISDPKSLIYQFLHDKGQALPDELDYDEMG
jgi:hypothetical protein